MLATKRAGLFGHVVPSIFRSRKYTTEVTCRPRMTSGCLFSTRLNIGNSSDIAAMTSHLMRVTMKRTGYNSADCQTRFLDSKLSKCHRNRSFLCSRTGDGVRYEQQDWLGRLWPMVRSSRYAAPTATKPVPNLTTTELTSRLGTMCFNSTESPRMGRIVIQSCM